jgi:hypothetical protein
LIQEDSLTHVDYQQNLETIYIQSHVKVQSSMTTTAASKEKENFNDQVELEKSEQYSPSNDCPNTWRSAFIILSFIFSILLACIKFVNGIHLSSTILLKAENSTKEAANNKKFVTLQRQTDILLNVYFLDLETEKANNLILSDQLATSDDVILSNIRSLELLNQKNRSQLRQLIDDNAILNSRIVELEDLNMKGIELIDLADADKLQLHHLINDNTILSKRIVELEALNQHEHALHVALQETCDEIFTSKELGKYIYIYVCIYIHIYI